jgi:hypothetical protein
MAPSEKKAARRGVGRPPIPEEDRKVAVKFRLHPRQIERLRKRAKTGNVSMGKLVGQLIES